MADETTASREFEREWTEMIVEALRRKVERGEYTNINKCVGIELHPSELGDPSDEEARRFLSLVVETGYFDELWQKYGMWVMRGWFLFFTEPTGQ